MSEEIKNVKHRTINIYAASFTSLVLLFFSFLIADGAAQGAKNDRKWVIVIDPGHGGRDPGALGSFSKEKDIALAVALKTGEYLQQNLKNVKVIYTRSSDVTVDLVDRPAIANKNNADLFISIHANWASSKSVTGAETFVMGLAKDAANLEVAMKENEVILLENDHSTKYEGFDPKSPESYIMFTLMQNTYQKQSTEFASRIQSQFRDGITRRDRGVKQAGFWVLFTTTMPSVLIETGFITNLTEEKYLTSKVGQDHLASSIYKACKDYINEINRRSGISASDIIASPILSDSQKVEQVTIPVSDLRFLVQIANSRTKTEIKPENFKGLKDVTEISIQDRFRYVSGSYADYETAVSHRKMIESYYPDAFVIAIKDNKILPLQKALEQVRNERNKTTNND
jgi:N-acetylmuramoyl-L-alanine amidase